MGVVYIDSVFLLNLIINYLMLLVAARIAGVGPRRLRVLGGAAVGGNTAVTTPLSASLATFVAPSTMKKSAATPFKV